MIDENVVIKFTRCRDGAILPSYAKSGDAGMDIVAATDVLLAPGETKLIPTGLKVAIPQGYELQVRPRSGLSLNTPLRIPNSPGTIDSGYRDEICVILNNSSSHPNINDIIQNLSNTSNNIDTIQNLSINISRNTNIISSFNVILTECNNQNMQRPFFVTTKDNKQGYYQIRKGDRVAQIVLNKVPSIIWKEEESVDDIGVNRGGGFGSTGHK